MKLFLIAFIAGFAVYLVKALYDYKQISAQGMSTSFPPSSAFVYAIPYGAGVFIVALIVVWFVNKIFY